MTDDLIGKQLDEYRLEALLGQGGMARVYRALDVRLERWVAIKVIDASFRSDSDYMARFEREARAIAQLEHPHIVSLYRYGEVDGLLYMAMRYIKGLAFNTLLASFHSEGKLMPVAEAHRVIHQICQALDYAHSRGVIHRDVKPANIMLDKQGNAFLTDFGLALVSEVGTRGEIFGTPHYIAPEQAMSSAGAVPQSDLYAVGVMLYEIFTGELPFDAANALDVAMLHMSEAPPPPHQIQPDITPELEAVILKTLEKEPEARYQTGAELVKALDQALKAASQVSLPLPPPGMSIPQRVALDLAARPLPPLPAGVPPTPNLDFRPAEVPPATDPDLQPAGAPSTKSRPFLYAGIGLGLLLVVGIGLILILVLAFFLLRRSDSTDEIAEAALPPTEAIMPAGAAATTEAGNETPTAEPAATLPEPTLQPTATQPDASAGDPPAGNTENPLVYELLIAKRGEDSIFLINQSITPFPLAPLQFISKDHLINAEIWEIGELGSGACVSAWKDKGKAQGPDISCNELGRLLVDGKDRFWRETFDVYYGGEWLASCDKGQKQCLVTIPAELSESDSRVNAEEGAEGGNDD